RGGGRARVAQLRARDPLEALRERGLAHGRIATQQVDQLFHAASILILGRPKMQRVIVSRSRPTGGLAWSASRFPRTRTAGSPSRTPMRSRAARFAPSITSAAIS